MPVQVSYPGVYVQAITTQPPTPSGVSTSVTAFFGRAMMGPVNSATQVLSYAEFERQFGGLNANYPLSYSVKAFFDNGGQQALITRLFTPVIADAALPTANNVIATLNQAAEPSDTDKKATFNTVGALIQKTIKSEAYAGFELTVANAYYAAYQAAAQEQVDTYNAAVTDPKDQITLDSTGQTALIDAALGEAADNTTGADATVKMSLNVANSTVTTATTVADAAYVASISSPSNPSPVISATSGSAAGFPTDPDKTTAMAILNAAQEPKFKNEPSTLEGGTAAGLAARFMAPQAAQQGLSTIYSTNLVANASTGKLSAPKDTAFTDLVDNYNAALDMAQTAQGVNWDTTSATALITTLTNKANSYKSKPGADGASTVLAAAESAANAGESTLAAILSATDAAAGVLGTYWPSGNTLQLEAANQGTWAENLTVTADVEGITSSIATSLGLPLNQLFNLRVQYITPAGQIESESFSNVTLDVSADDQHRLDKVLAAESIYVRIPVDSSGDPELPSDFQIATDKMAASSRQPGTGQDSGSLSITEYVGDQEFKTGLYALDNVDLFNIMCIPPDQWDGNTDPYVNQMAADYCATRYAMYIIDPPTTWTDAFNTGNLSSIKLSDLGSLSVEAARASAVYFPRIVAEDPLQNGQQRVFAPSGYMAGIWASTDASRGVWKAPAGMAAVISGIVGLNVKINDAQNGQLNPHGINCLRTFDIGGTVVWGARTMRGDNQFGDEYKYIPVERMLQYLENSLLRNTKWAVFEPNAEPLWAALRLNVGTFLAGLFKQGAFAGTSASDAYFVKCDSSTTTQTDIDNGIVNVQVGFAPLKPAEFVVITIQQIAGKSSS